MQTQSLAKIKKELSHYTENQLLEICLRLAKYKTENKELLSYLLFQIDREDDFIENLKIKITDDFTKLNKNAPYFLRKGVRKILRETKKYIRYSQNKKTEVDLLLHFCEELFHLKPSIKKHQALLKLFENQLAMAKKGMLALHEDLQHDYHDQIERLEF